MKTGFVAVLFVLLLVIIIYACVINKRASDTRKRTAELRRQHERHVDRKVKLTRGQRFDCPACGSAEPCSRCLRL